MNDFVGNILQNKFYAYDYIHGRRNGGPRPPLDFEIISKKWLFFQFSRDKNQISPLLAPPGKKFGKIPYCPPPRKNPSDAHGYTLLSRIRRSTPICGAGVLLRCNWCRNLDAVELHTAVVGNYFCCSRPTLKRPHLAEDRAFYESRSKSRLIASALIFTISWRNFQI